MHFKDVQLDFQMCSELVIPDGIDYPLMQSVPLKVIVALSLVSAPVGWGCVWIRFYVFISKGLNDI